MSIDYDHQQNYRHPMSRKRLEKSLTDETAGIITIGNNGTDNLSALRLNFRKSHTCGSLFAKCNCGSRTQSIISSASSASLTSKTTSSSLLSNSSSGNFHSSSNNKTKFILNDDDYNEFDYKNDTTNDTLSNANNENYIFYCDNKFSNDYDDVDYTMMTNTAISTSNIGCGLSNIKGEIVSSKQFTTDSVRGNNIVSTLSQHTNPINSELKSASVYPNTSATNENSISNTTINTCNSISNIISSDNKSKNTIKINTNNIEKKPRKLFQSYSHPDTTFIFTDENKNASINNQTIPAVRANSTTVTTKNGKVEITHPKRLSSPNIGNYAILDVAIHPEILLKISTRNDLSKEKLSTTTITSSSSRSSVSSSKTLIGLPTTTTTTLKNKPQQQQHSNRPVLKRSQRTFTPTDSFDDIPDNSEQYNYSLSFNTMATEQSTTQQQTKNINCNIVGELEHIESNNPPNLLPTTSIEFLPQNSNITEINDENLTHNDNLEYLKLNAIGHQELAKESKNFQGSQQYTNRNTSKSSSNESKGRNILNRDLENITRTIEKDIKSNYEKQHDETACENKTKSLHDEINKLHDLIKDRDSEICKLKREIHKLKSVLQQTTANSMSLGDTNMTSTSCLQTYHCSSNSGQHHLPQLPTAPCISNHYSNNNNNNNNQLVISSINNKSNDCIEESCENQNCDTSYENKDDFDSITISSNDQYKNITATIPSQSTTLESGCDSIMTASSSLSGTTNKSNQMQQNHLSSHVVSKKQGVSGESSDAASHQCIHIPIPKFEKDFRSKQLIKDAIMDNDFLKNIDSSQVRELVESMYSLTIAKGEYVIREGEAGSHLYVSAEGEFEVKKNDETLGLMGPGKAFGELAILYNCTRTASIRVLSDAKVWVLDRRVFQQIMMRTGLQRIEENVNFLKSVPLLKNLSNDVLTKIADCLEVEFYPAGSYIIRQGASGDSFFLISQGTVKVTQKLPNSQEEKEIRILERGDYFGEQALINEDKRTANIIALDPGVECLTLDRESFTHLIGDLCELKQKSYGDEGRILANKIETEAKEIFGTNVKQEFLDLKLSDLQVVATLGLGGFGRVELVKCNHNNKIQTFALKCLKKKHIIDTRQEEHVFSERTIMLSCNTPFICRLYRTFRDTKYVYMLLEACMGGEVWTILRDRGCFNETLTQFIIGCVLEAFEYLHSRGIIYRDLKPENLMLDERGYVKLVDFGFAKYIGQTNKTWTFCGTPEYVAPEIILNKGHDRAVDYWALGILIHELLNGTPPFTAPDPMKTYNIILKGIDMIDFPKHMSRAAVNLIKKLCRDIPAERLGYQKNGIQDIRKHKWFQGFDWDGLSNLTLIPPFLRPVSNALDTSYFDQFPVDTEIPPDETSGWDAEF